MLELSCLPCTAFAALKASFYTYGGVKLVSIGLEGEFCSEVAALEEESILRALPPELLAEIVVMLPCSVYKCALRVSRLWYKTLNHEILWERLCRWQWPGVSHNVSNSWQVFAMQGGGDMLGACLLRHLQGTTLVCTANLVQCCLVESIGVRCNACGDTNLHGMAVLGCRTCKYNRCDKCYKALQPPAAITNGAANHQSKDGWSALHYACRLGFKDVVNKLLDARTDADCRDGLHGYTPLMVGATHGHDEICRLLLERGATKGPINHYAKTAADCAHSWGHAELGKLLGQTG